MFITTEVGALRVILLIARANLCTFPDIDLLRRNTWVDPNSNLDMVKLRSMSSIVLLPHEYSTLKYEGILKLENSANIGHLKTALAVELNNRRPVNDPVDPL